MFQRPLAPAGRVLARVAIDPLGQPAYRVGLSLVVLFVAMIVVLGALFVASASPEAPFLDPNTAAGQTP